MEGTWKLDVDNSAVLGYKLARELDLKLGDTFKLISPMNSKVTPMGLKPKVEIFTLVGLFRSGMYEYDSKFIFIDREKMAEFNSMENEFTMVEVKLKPDWIERADYTAYVLEHEFNYQFQISSWVDFNSNLSEIVKKYQKAKNIIIEFGAPNRGLLEIAKDEAIDIRKHTDFLVNTIPKQGTETIRTEEAVIATLAVFNSLKN